MFMFFSTFGIIIICYLIIGRFLGDQIKKKGGNYWTVFLSLFNTFNGKPDF